MCINICMYTYMYTTMKRVVTKWHIPSIQKFKTLKIKPTLIY